MQQCVDKLAEAYGHTLLRKIRREWQVARHGIITGTSHLAKSTHSPPIDINLTMSTPLSSLTKVESIII